MPDSRPPGHQLLALTEEELQRIVLDVHAGPAQYLFAALGQALTSCCSPTTCCVVRARRG